MKSRALEELTEETLGTLSRAGFIVEEIDYPEEGRSVDVVGRSGDKKVILKVVYDSARVSRREIEDLKKLSATYRASVLIVSEKYWKTKMEDDVVYVRNDIYVVNKNLLRDYLLKNSKPIVLNVRGNYLVRISSKGFAKRRLELGLSRSEVANRLNISREAVYQYETRRSMTSIQTAIKIAELLGEDVFEEIDLLNESMFNKYDTSSESPLLSELLSLVNVRNAKLYSFTTTPVDAAIVKDEKTVSIVRLTGFSKSEIELKTDNAVKLTRVTRSTPLFIHDEMRIERIGEALREILGE
jgi:putative transcriptional regulator